MKRTGFKRKTFTIKTSNVDALFKSVKRMKRTKLRKVSNLMESLGNKPRTGEVRKCQTCQKEFYSRPALLTRNPRFCSITCVGKWQKTGENYNCTVCGKEYYKNNGQIKHRGETKYCSKKCKGTAMKKMIRAYGYKPQTKVKPRITTLKRKLWKVFADYVKKRDKYTCVTCGEVVGSYNCHAGHFIPKSVGGIVLYFHPDNVHAQCARCNIWLSGNQYLYGERLGPEKVKELYALKNGPPQKWDAERYEYEINWYKQLLSEMDD